jgi:hypothetical protein
MAAESKRSKDAQSGKQVHLAWTVPLGMPLLYATNFVIQRVEEDHVLYVFEALPPLITGTPEEQRSQMAAVREVPAKCLARIVVTKSRLEALGKIIGEHLARKPEAGS